MLRNFFLLKLALGFAIVLAGLNYIAGIFYFYWTLGWYDYMMHYLGGVSVALLVAWFISHKSLSWGNALITIFLVTMFMGGAWEVFEYVNGITFATEGYTLDTVHDLLMDALGALTVGYLYIRNRNGNRN